MMRHAQVETAQPIDTKTNEPGSVEFSRRRGGLISAALMVVAGPLLFNWIHKARGRHVGLTCETCAQTLAPTGRSWRGARDSATCSRCGREVTYTGEPLGPPH